VADLCSPEFVPPGTFDLVFSLSTAEHVRDARLFHTNVRRLLRDGGRAVHFFPTLYSLPFVVNRALPERLSEPLLRAVMSGREHDGSHGKIPARYEWCRGPSRRQIARLESCGFSIERYCGYFGHVYYRRLGLEPLMAHASSFLVRHPVPALTAFALVVLEAR
jgi:SAM-dependent methyltransferase